MRRVTWFVAGAASGVAGAAYTQRKVRAAAAKLSPSHVARQAGQRARTRGRDLVQAVREGREAMRRKEVAMRSEREPDASPPAATAAQVIVLSDVRALDHLLDRTSETELSPPAGRRRRGRR